MHSNVLVP